MGYSTTFTGKFNLDRPLAPEHKAYLEAFAETRRMARDAALTEMRDDPLRLAVGLPVGSQGGYFVGADAPYGQEGMFADPQRRKPEDLGILDVNRMPDGQPGLWCQWVPSKDGGSIEWGRGEKFYRYVDWLEYIIEHFLVPWGYTLNGEVKWKGEDREDRGTIVVIENLVSTR